ncbi:MAG: hypothetical protein SFY68_06940, partial [Candidatus Sumerlaeia bacterium]|nr:hypothetical protein [Candidatus Sumerlaeia bacterium]
MKRISSLGKFSFTLQASILCLSVGIAGMGFSQPADTVIVRQSPGKDKKLVQATNRAVLVFPESVTGNKGKSEAKALADKIGLKSTGRVLTPQELIVEGDYDTAKKLVSQSSDAKSSGISVRPLYYLNGIPNEKTEMTLHTRLVVNYQVGVALDDRLKLENTYGLTNPRVLSAEMVSYDTPVASEESAGLADRIWTENASLVQFVEPVMSS